MFLHKRTLYLVLCFLLVGSAAAARKTKRPVKPAKTFPRTNVTPAPQAAAAAAAAAASSSSSSSASSAFTSSGSSSTTPKIADAVNHEEALLSAAGAGSSMPNIDEVPKPLSIPAAETGSGGSAEAKTERPEAAAAAAAAGDSSSIGSSSGALEEEDCDPDMIGFEIITGYVLSAPSSLLDTLPGTLMLTDCLEACQANESCSAVNYETGLCVLFRTTADRLPGSLSRSQFPVFTIYAQKSCLGVRPCAKAWCVDRVQGYRLPDHVRSSQSVFSRRDCLELCLGETEFTCRSANFYRHSGLCELSEMDRITLTGAGSVEPYDGADYLENNCAEEPSKLCEFRRLSGRILKTVDSVYQDIGNIEECRDLCLNSPYRCHSYDYNDTGDMVCRLSHHSRATLTDVLEPYLAVPEAATYELSSCYNVSIECRSGEMLTRIRTSKLFDGKVYAKGAPKSCAVHVNRSLEFEFRMGYADLECNVRQSAFGRYMNDIVIQHHATIVTSADLGLAVSCQYDLTNKTVANDVDLGVTGEIESSLSEEIVIDSPSVVMKITSRDGGDMKRVAEVGDPLALRFEIVEPDSPYEIFVRELVALDGSDNAEITLIDARGCPTDQYIMGAIQRLSHNRKVLLSQFDAFKFPSSEVVQFRALVTPCIPRCEPVVCDNEDAGSGELKSLVSYGRRRRSAASLNTTEAAESLVSSARRSSGRARRDVSPKPADDNILLVQSIQITDKFGFAQEDGGDASGAERREKIYAGSAEEALTCLNGYALVIASAVFLLAQLAVLAIWKHVQQRNRKERHLYAGEQSPASALNYAAPNTLYAQSTRGAAAAAAASASDTLGKLYDSGMSGRYGQQF